ncbi:hypothetical protein NQZ68_000431 [Dissostichus eleginoides]|nr:hypothetical protein NQZ68_000431 [Dissostichus eleginoides]
MPLVSLCDIPRMSPVLFPREFQLTCITSNADKVGSRSPSSVRENVSANDGRAQADTDFNQDTLCHLSGDFPLGEGEKQVLS